MHRGCTGGDDLIKVSTNSEVRANDHTQYPQRTNSLSPTDDRGGWRQNMPNSATQTYTDVDHLAKPDAITHHTDIDLDHDLDPEFDLAPEFDLDPEFDL